MQFSHHTIESYKCHSNLGLIYLFHIWWCENVFSLFYVPVTVSLKQSIQPFTLSNKIENNVITIYKYTKANVNRDTTFTADKYYTFDNETGYTAKTKYESGNIYYEKEVLATSTVTVEDNKLKTVASVDIVICGIVDDSHSDRCEETSHCGFDLHFPDD